MEKRKRLKNLKIKEKSKRKFFCKTRYPPLFYSFNRFRLIGGTVVNAVGGNFKIPYIISSIVYACALVCGVASLKIDKDDQKKGYEPTGNKNYAYISIFLSIFVALVNISQIILK